MEILFNLGIYLKNIKNEGNGAAIPVASFKTIMANLLSLFGKNPFHVAKSPYGNFFCYMYMPKGAPFQERVRWITLR